MNNKGIELNRRVWSLFEKAGFETKPSTNDPSEEVVTLSPAKKRTVDLSAWDRTLGIKIIGWNKARKELSEALTVHFNDYSILMKEAKANSVLFVSTGKEILSDDRDYAERFGMRVWGENELRYYEALVDAIGNYAKYEIIHSFGLETKEEKNIYNVLSLHFQQPHSNSDADLFLFTITPEKLLKTCVVYRKAQQSADAYQRMVKKARLRSIRKFVTQPSSLLPPAIIVHLSEKSKWDPINNTFANQPEETGI